MTAGIRRLDMAAHRRMAHRVQGNRHVGIARKAIGMHLHDLPGRSGEGRDLDRGGTGGTRRHKVEKGHCIALILKVLDHKGVHTGGERHGVRALGGGMQVPVVDHQGAIHPHAHAIIGAGAQQIAAALQGKGARPASREKVRLDGRPRRAGTPVVVDGGFHALEQGRPGEIDAVPILRHPGAERRLDGGLRRDRAGSQWPQGQHQ